VSSTHVVHCQGRKYRGWGKGKKSMASGVKYRGWRKEKSMASGHETQEREFIKPTNLY